MNSNELLIKIIALGLCIALIMAIFMNNDDLAILLSTGLASYLMQCKKRE